MVHVGGTWELGWNAPVTEAYLWGFPLRDFRVDGWHMWPVSGIRRDDVTEHESAEAMLEWARAEGMAIVFVDENADVELSAFDHPEHAMYVLGKASRSMLPSRKEGDLAVVIHTAEAKGLMWPHQAACVVLYHRAQQWPSR